MRACVYARVLVCIYVFTCIRARVQAHEFRTAECSNPPPLTLPVRENFIGEGILDDEDQNLTFRIRRVRGSAQEGPISLDLAQKRYVILFPPSSLPLSSPLALFFSLSRQLYL